MARLVALDAEETKLLVPNLFPLFFALASLCVPFFYDVQLSWAATTVFALFVLLVGAAGYIFAEHREWTNGSERWLARTSFLLPLLVFVWVAYGLVVLPLDAPPRYGTPDYQRTSVLLLSFAGAVTAWKGRLPFSWRVALCLLALLALGQPVQVYDDEGRDRNVIRMRGGSFVALFLLELYWGGLLDASVDRLYLFHLGLVYLFVTPTAAVVLFGLMLSRRLFQLLLRGCQFQLRVAPEETAAPIPKGPADPDLSEDDEEEEEGGEEEDPEKGVVVEEKKKKPLRGGRRKPGRAARAGLVPPRRARRKRRDPPPRRQQPQRAAPQRKGAWPSSVNPFQPPK